MHIMRFILRAFTKSCSKKIIVSSVYSKIDRYSSINKILYNPIYLTIFLASAIRMASVSAMISKRIGDKGRPGVTLFSLEIMTYVSIHSYPHTTLLNVML
jgi:hypothetical protein